MTRNNVREIKSADDITQEDLENVADKVKDKKYDAEFVSFFLSLSFLAYSFNLFRLTMYSLVFKSTAIKLMKQGPASFL